MSQPARDPALLHTTDKAKQKELITAALRDEPIPGPIHLLAKSWF